MPVPIIDTPPIVITASRAPATEETTAASVSIIDEQLIVRLDEPTIAALVRLTPSASVGTSGPAGSLTDVRIRGAESNHTLLFVDGIKANDPASGDIPRFELLGAGIASRIEVVRGPQSALWGSDAIGGVIAINGVPDQPGYSATAEAGSFGTLRGAVTGAVGSAKSDASGAVAVQRASGIDSFGSPGGDKDGFRNLAARLRAATRLSDDLQLGFTGLGLAASSQFDGYDPITFEHTDTRDGSRNRLFAGRAWAAIGKGEARWSGRISASLLASSNRNLLAGNPVNRTRGDRRTLEAQLQHRFRVAGMDHQLILAADSEREHFHARDTLYGGASNQDRGRTRHALVAEWRGHGKIGDVDLAIRRDLFNRFRDATTIRVSALVPLDSTWSLAASYGEGIAAPTFFDLYGFFPNNFVGNSALRPESSKGFEGALRYAKGPLAASVTAYRQQLHDEIVDVYDPVTFLQSTRNRDRLSRRLGVEMALSWAPDPRLRLQSSYAFLKADQPDDAGGHVVELRRPRHSGSIAADGQWGQWTYGATIAYVGIHRDVRDSYPYDVVKLGDYWFADARVAFAIRPGIELFARASNLFDSNYQDAAGYRTEGRGLFAGIRLAGRRS